MAADTGSFGIMALVMQALMTIAFYSAELDLSEAANTDKSSVYNFYVGVALMMFVGFGYLMTFLKSYGLGAVGFTMYITCLGVEFAIIIESFMGKGALNIDFMSLLNGNFAVAAVLISFGGLIGKISPLQCTVVTVVELTCYCVNKVYFLKQYDESPLIADCGGTIIIHVFGAYFGLMACTVLGPPKKDELNASSYSSDLFSLIGTVFLWLFWPSFVAGGLPSGAGQTTALINTVLALLASTMTTFGLTPLLDGGMLNTAAVQNATLAGGVSIGATANLVGLSEPLSSAALPACSPLGASSKHHFSQRWTHVAFTIFMECQVFSEAWCPLPFLSSTQTPAWMPSCSAMALSSLWHLPVPQEQQLVSCSSFWPLLPILSVMTLSGAVQMTSLKQVDLRSRS